MVYFVFDMDETLAELYSVFYFIASLRLKDSCSDDKALCDSLPNTLLSSLNEAYDIFVEAIAAQEASSRPLGILRPGILAVMNRINSLRDKIDGVIIYSNNGHLESLKFIRDIIHAHLKTTSLIKDCIHWDHHMRDTERNLGPNAENKTWSVLKSILVHGPTKAPPALTPAEVYFFDDLDHPDLQRNLGKNYYKVPPYTYRTSFDLIAHIYKDAILKAKVDTNQLLDYAIEIFIDTPAPQQKDNESALDMLLRIFKAKTPGTAYDPPPKDQGIQIMNHAINSISRRGGKRSKTRTKKKTHRAHSISNGRKKLKRGGDYS